MTASELYEFNFGSIVAGAFASVTETLYATMAPRCGNPVALVRCNDFEGEGQVEVKASHCVDDPHDSTVAGWVDAMAFSNITAASASETVFWSTSRPCLPYWKVEAVAKETAGEELAIHNLVVKLLAEVK